MKVCLWRWMRDVVYNNEFLLFFWLCDDFLEKKPQAAPPSLYVINEFRCDRIRMRKTALGGKAIVRKLTFAGRERERPGTFLRSSPRRLLERSERDVVLIRKLVKASRSFIAGCSSILPLY